MGAILVPVTTDPIALLGSVAKGNEQALAALYDAYSAALYGVVARMVEKEELAQEILQDTFVRIWRNAVDYDSSKGRPFTWMMNIARNRAIDALRSAEVKRSASIRSLDGHVYRVGQDATGEAMDKADVRSALDRLRPEHRELIEMAYFNGFSQQEIADGTGLPLGTVKSRTRSALMELRTLLKDHR